MKHIIIILNPNVCYVRKLVENIEDYLKSLKEDVSIVPIMGTEEWKDELNTPFLFYTENIVGVLEQKIKSYLKGGHTVSILCGSHLNRSSKMSGTIIPEVYLSKMIYSKFSDKARVFIVAPDADMGVLERIYGNGIGSQYVYVADALYQCKRVMNRVLNV